MIGKFTNSLIEGFINELKKEENQEKFKESVLDPLIYHTLDKLYPYIFLTAIIFVLILLITIMILFLIIRHQYSK